MKSSLRIISAIFFVALLSVSSFRCAANQGQGQKQGSQTHGIFHGGFRGKFAFAHQASEAGAARGNGVPLLQ
jgi:hypothetical protein